MEKTQTVKIQNPVEEDIKAGRLDHLVEKALEDLRAGRCKDL